MKRTILISIAAASSGVGPLMASQPEEVFLKRIQNHLLIEDYEAACGEAAAALRQHSQSKALCEQRIRALARAGEERAALAAWEEYAALYPGDEAGQERALEEVAWGTIRKTACSSSPPLRLLGILAAFLSQDARGIALLKKGLHDTNIQIRAATVKLVGNLHDATLQDEVERLIVNEKVWRVRVEAIKAAGAMKVKKVRPALVAIAADPNVHALERAAAIGALVQMQKSISREELSRLVQSDRAGMRILACEIVARLQLKEEAALLMPLLRDHAADVRAEALHTVGLLRMPIDLDKGEVVRLMDDPDPGVAMAAAWAVALSSPEKGQRALQKFIDDPDEGVRRHAAGALVAAGKYGFPLMEKAFDASPDPYVRLNLALGLIGQRVRTQDAADVIFASLGMLKEQWMEDEEGLFTAIVPSTVRHDELIPNAPEAVNQKTRLELLNILAVLKHPRAQEAVRQFLTEKKWGITGMASAVLLTEGDEQAIDLVKGLLSEKDANLRLQAALVLALWGGSDEALAILEEAYVAADFEEKEKILEGVGRVGSKKSLRFLVERLHEPHQTLRLIAAAGIVQILYN